MLSKLLSLFKTTNIVSVRGATTVIEDTKKDIEIKTSKLLQEIFSSNNITKKDILFIIFSSTEDLKSYYPASVARKNFGLLNESLFTKRYNMYGKRGSPRPRGIWILIIAEYKIPPKALLNFVTFNDLARR